MLDVSVYLYTAGYHLLDRRDTQYGHKVICHFLMILTLTPQSSNRHQDNIEHVSVSFSSTIYKSSSVWFSCAGEQQNN